MSSTDYIFLQLLGQFSILENEPSKEAVLEAAALHEGALQQLSPVQVVVSIQLGLHILGVNSESAELRFKNRADY